jgi:hypothetical protein
MESEETGGLGREKGVGITEYLSDHEGFFAVLKRRYIPEPRQVHVLEKRE